MKLISRFILSLLCLLTSPLSALAIEKLTIKPQSIEYLSELETPAHQLSLALVENHDNDYFIITRLGGKFQYGGIQRYSMKSRFHQSIYDFQATERPPASAFTLAENGNFYALNQQQIWMIKPGKNPSVENYRLPIALDTNHEPKYLITKNNYLYLASNSHPQIYEFKLSPQPEFVRAIDLPINTSKFCGNEISTQSANKPGWRDFFITLLDVLIPSAHATTPFYIFSACEFDLHAVINADQENILFGINYKIFGKPLYSQIMRFQPHAEHPIQVLPDLDAKQIQGAGILTLASTPAGRVVGITLSGGKFGNGSIFEYNHSNHAYRVLLDKSNGSWFPQLFNLNEHLYFNDCRTLYRIGLNDSSPLQVIHSSPDKQGCYPLNFIKLSKPDRLVALGIESGQTYLYLLEHQGTDYFKKQQIKLSKQIHINTLQPTSQNHAVFLTEGKSPSEDAVYRIQTEDMEIEKIFDLPANFSQAADIQFFKDAHKNLSVLVHYYCHGKTYLFQKQGPDAIKFELTKDVSGPIQVQPKTDLCLPIKNEYHAGIHPTSLQAQTQSSIWLGLFENDLSSANSLIKLSAEGNSQRYDLANNIIGERLDAILSSPLETIYGATSQGGLYGFGSLFEISATKSRPLYHFKQAMGSTPQENFSLINQRFLIASTEVTINLPSELGIGLESYTQLNICHAIYQYDLKTAQFTEITRYKQEHCGFQSNLQTLKDGSILLAISNQYNSKEGQLLQIFPGNRVYVKSIASFTAPKAIHTLQILQNLQGQNYLSVNSGQQQFYRIALYPKPQLQELAVNWPVAEKLSSSTLRPRFWIIAADGNLYGLSNVRAERRHRSKNTQNALFRFAPSSEQVEVMAVLDHPDGFSTLSPKLTEIDAYLYGALQYYDRSTENRSEHRGPFKTRLFRYPLAAE